MGEESRCGHGNWRRWIFGEEGTERPNEINREDGDSSRHGVGEGEQRLSEGENFGWTTWMRWLFMGEDGMEMLVTVREKR